jgi:hypothetical protein
MPACNLRQLHLSFDSRNDASHIEQRFVTRDHGVSTANLQDSAFVSEFGRASTINLTLRPNAVSSQQEEKLWMQNNSPLLMLPGGTVGRFEVRAAVAHVFRTA